jgi:uncharacterized protein YbaR (Trm112 family)
MQAQSDREKLKAFEAWVSELACPACLGALRLGDASVVCAQCDRVYPVVDGIPVLIVERAKSTPSSL